MPCPANELIGACATDQRIVTGSTIQLVVSSFAIDQVMAYAGIDRIVTRASMDDITQTIGGKGHAHLAGSRIGHVRSAVNIANNRRHSQVALDVAARHCALGINREIKSLVTGTAAIGDDRILDRQHHFVAGHRVRRQVDLPVGSHLGRADNLPFRRQPVNEQRGQRQFGLGAQLQRQYTRKAATQLAGVVTGDDVNARGSGNLLRLCLRGRRRIASRARAAACAQDRSLAISSAAGLAGHVRPRRLDADGFRRRWWRRRW